MGLAGHLGQVLTDSMGYATFTVTSAPQFSHLTILVSPGGGPIAIDCILNISSDHFSVIVGFFVCFWTEPMLSDVFTVLIVVFIGL